jgi:hypothetical protein
MIIVLRVLLKADLLEQEHSLRIFDALITKEGFYSYGTDS